MFRDRLRTRQCARLVSVDIELRTERLRLRRWTVHDRKPFADLNADPIVMEFFPATLSQTESDAFVDRIEDDFDQHQFGLWAVELTETCEFVGYVGLWSATFEAPFAPAIEVGWRLARQFWGYGLAPEAARAAVADGFERLALNEIVSFTSRINLKSRRVMEKLGMTYDPADDFEHPSVPLGNLLRPHVLYRLQRPFVY
jgi:RimJ/RimL family protein N-acetyltransferase